MPPTRPAVTPAEWDVLEILWERAPLSAREVFEARPEKRRGSPQTVRTLLERLLAKKVVERREVHGVWVFSPRFGRADVVRGEGRNFLRRFFRGRPELGAAYFIENADIAPDELRRLKKLVEERLARHRREEGP